MQRQPSIATILIGKRALIREGIARILGAANFRISASVSCADDLPPGQPGSNQLLFLVVHTGDDFNVALEQIELLRDRHPAGRIAIVADYYRRDELVSAFQAGANGCFFDITTCDVFIKSIELMMMGETIFPRAFLSSELDPKSDQIDKAVPRKGYRPCSPGPKGFRPLLGLQPAGDTAAYRHGVFGVGRHQP